MMTAKLLARSNLSNFVSACRSFCAEAATVQRGRFDINRVVLCGKTIKPSYRLENGLTTLLLATSNEQNPMNIHAILTKVPFDVAENQKVYIEGVLQQNPFVTIDNKKRSAGRIRAFHTSLIDSNYEDINSIELCGFVAGDLIKTTEFSMYRIATHFMPPNAIEQQVSFHTIRVYGDKLRGAAEQTIEKSKTIRLIGSLEYDKYTADDGKSVKGVIIRATNILKPIRMQARIEEVASDVDA